MSQASRDNFPEAEIRNIMTETIDTLDDVIANVSSRIPVDFPEVIADSIFNGMRSMRESAQRTL